MQKATILKFHMYGIYIKASNVVDHLGNQISSTLSSNENINTACINFSVGVNSVSALFCTVVSDMYFSVTFVWLCMVVHCGT